MKKGTKKVVKKKKEAIGVNRDTAIQGALKELRKKYGDSVILQSDDIPKDIEVVSTNCFAIDYVLGCNGLPRGRIIEVFGQESSGKSTLCLFFAAQIQKAGGLVAYVDVENAYDASYASKIGVQTEKMMVAQSETLEEAFDTIRALAETNEVDLIIVDSVAALTPKSELEGNEMLKETMALQARLIGKAMRIITGPVSRSKTIVIFINQLRMKVGVFWGNPEVTPGGKALKFFSSVRLNVTKGNKILGDKDEQIGNIIKMTTVKNKVGFPFRSGTFDLYYGEGVDLIADCFDTAAELGVIKKTGNTYDFENNKIGVGRNQTIEVLRGASEVYDRLLTATQKAVKLKGTKTKK